MSETKSDDRRRLLVEMLQERGWSVEELTGCSGILELSLDDCPPCGKDHWWTTPASGKFEEERLKEFLESLPCARQPEASAASSQNAS